jgi:hypothetical protein
MEYSHRMTRLRKVCIQPKSLSEVLARRRTEISAAGDSGVEHEADAPAAERIAMVVAVRSSTRLVAAPRTTDLFLASANM